MYLLQLGKELKTPGKPRSEEPGGIWDSAGAHEQCVSLPTVLYCAPGRGPNLILQGTGE